MSPPDPAVTKAENELVKVTRGKMIDGFPGRRSYGTKGQPIILRTNYLRLSATCETDPNTSEGTLYKYDVDGLSELNKKKRKEFMNHLLRDPMFTGRHVATDYAKIVVTNAKLDFENATEWKTTVVLPAPPPAAGAQTNQGPLPEFVQRAREQNRANVRVRHQETYNLRDMINFLQSTSAGAHYQGRVDIIPLLNMILYRSPSMDNSIATVGQNKFYPIQGNPRHENIELGGGLQAVRGYFSSVRPATHRLLINLNVSSAAFFKPIPLVALVIEFGSTNHDLIEAFIKKLRVRVEYKTQENQQNFVTRYKTIFGFARRQNRSVLGPKEVTFAYTDRTRANPQEEQITIFNYFRRVHGITLQLPDLPVLNVGNLANPQWIPQELCTVVPGQSYQRLLNGKQTTDMLKFAARAPNLNAESIAGSPTHPGNGLRVFNLETANQVNSVRPFGFNVGTEMITVPGRILPSPHVFYGTDGRDIRTTSQGEWNMKDRKFHKPARYSKWKALVVNGGTMANDINQLENSLRGYGLQMGERLPTEVLQLQPLIPAQRETNDQALREAFEKAQKIRVQMLFIVLEENDKWLYARIKYYGDVKFGIHTICSVGYKLQKKGGQDMYMGNLALKFNIKGGGVSHLIGDTLKAPLDIHTMLVGIDVTHPSPGSKEGAPSVACVVASVDQFLAHWPGSVRTQKGRQEMVDGLEEMVLERLKLWEKKNKSLPKKIVIYRDGVSEGQYQRVLEEELPPFQEAFKRRYGAEKNWPKVAVIIVGKRHHTRFYPTKREDTDWDGQRGSYNPKPGTIVDRGIANKTYHEFWMQAHRGLQGTARPAHYVVIKDEINIEADQLEQFTHKLCYLFNRATKAVSICPPAYYADLLCERARCYLFNTLTESTPNAPGQIDWTRDVHPSMAESTWYI